MKVGIIGTGYVGLVTGTCLSKVLNHDVICIDNIEAKIDKLKHGESPIFEPGLNKLLQSTKGGLLTFSTHYSDIMDCDLVMICVGAPQKADGSTDLAYIASCVHQIAELMTHDMYVVIKSTVPVGTVDKMKNLFKEYYNDIAEKYNIYFSSNPEFLKEGSAVEDFLNPSRVIIGADDPESKARLLKLYEAYSDKCYCFSVNAAQLIKYAANSFLATKISFINSLIHYCEKRNVNIQDVATGIGLDPRIGQAFLQAGPGYGGSCFPKDLASLSYEIKHATEDSPDNIILESVKSINEKSKMWPVYKIIEEFYDDNICTVKPITIGILGAAFKAFTDDVRCSSSIDCVYELFKLNKNITIKIFDPIASKNFVEYLYNNTDMSSKSLETKTNYNLITTDTAYEAVEGADAVILMTPWPEFLALNYSKVKCLMNGDVFIDARAMLDDTAMNALFNYYAIGKPHKEKN